jgi:hypothetical protein
MNSMKPNTRALLAALTILAATLAAVSGCAGAKPGLPSVIVRDTIVVTETKTLVDTLELYRDTTIYQEKVKLDIRYVDRKVAVRADCLPDTIRINQVRVVHHQAPETPANQKKWGWLESLVIMVAVLWFVFYGLRKIVDKFFE